MDYSVRCETTKDIPRDPHLLLLSELERQDRYDSSRPDIIGGRKVDQRLGASDQYIILNSTLKDPSHSDPSTGLFSFSIASGGSSCVGRVGVVNELNDIIEIEVQSFPFPRLPEDQYPHNPTLSSSLPILIPNPNSLGLQLSQVDTNRVLLQIKETSVQSFSDADGKRHNFAFDFLNVNGQQYASPVSPVYVFTDPLTSMTSLTIQFTTYDRPLAFYEDTMVNTKFGIETIPSFDNKDNVVVVVFTQISTYTNYAYNPVTGTLTFDVPMATDTVFKNLNSTLNTWKYDNTNLDTTSRILFDNIGGVGPDIGNGVYSLTTLTDDGIIAPNTTFTLLFTRVIDLDVPSEVNEHVAVGVSSGTFIGKKYILNNNVIDFGLDTQEWLDYSNNSRLSLYYDNHQLTTHDRLLCQYLKHGVIPQKIHTHLCRTEGIYVGLNGLGANAYRLNPDVVMSEFIVSSLTNNFITSRAAEAATYGFNTLKSGQVVVAPNVVLPGYSSDFANIIVRKSFTIGPALQKINTIYNTIIALTGQSNPSLNGYYQLETLDDIKADGIRLTFNDIYPLAHPTLTMPARTFSIPMRVRRILRRVTNMGGL